MPSFPLIESRPDFGGIWIDGPTGGVVVAMTDKDADLDAKISRELEGGLPVRFVTTPTPWSKLEAAVPEARSLWESSVPSIDLYAVRARASSSEIVLDVPAEDMLRAGDEAARLAESLGVPVRAQAGKPAVDTYCLDRDHCYDPFFGGIRARNGSVSSNGICTMGFHVSQAGDERWLTAGHCGVAYSSTSWYHTGYGRIGGEVGGGNLIYDGVDAMIVNLGDSESSSIIFSSLAVIGSNRYPILNETLCATLGVSSTAHKCGTVTDTYLTWTSSIAGVTVHGADLSITQVVGDSGSPYYTPGDPWDTEAAVGIGDTSGGYFARVSEVASALNVSVLTCGWCGH